MRNFFCPAFSMSVVRWLLWWLGCLGLLLGFFLGASESSLSCWLEWGTPSGLLVINMFGLQSSYSLSNPCHRLAVRRASGRCPM